MTMTMKKIIAVVLALTLCVSLCSCSDTEKQAGSIFARIILAIISPGGGQEPNAQIDVANDVPPVLIDEPDPELEPDPDPELGPDPTPEPEPDPEIEPDPDPDPEPDPPTPPTPPTPPPVTSGEVPSVAGLSKSNATATLNNAGFENIVYKEEYDNSVDKGLVIGHNPVAGSTAEFSAQITVEISKGPRVAIGNPMVDFTLPVMGGGELTLSSLRGKVIFINFWATYCSPCMGEMPDIQLLRENYGDELAILAVSLDGATYNADVQEYIENNGYTFTVLRDYNGATKYRTYPGEGSIPYSIIIDPNGDIAFTMTGAPYYAYSVYSAQIDAALRN